MTEEPPTAAKVDDYVVVTVHGKKMSREYVAFVRSHDQDNDFTVKFMKRSCGDKFVFTDEDDTYVIDSQDIVKVLRCPTINQRGQYHFENITSEFPRIC